MKDVASGQVDVRAGKVDFHVHVVGGIARVNINNRLVVHAVDKPADAVSISRTRGVDRALHRIRASNGRQVDVIGVVRKIRNRIEIPAPGCESVIALNTKVSLAAVPVSVLPPLRASMTVPEPEVA